MDDFLCHFCPEFVELQQVSLRIFDVKSSPEQYIPESESYIRSSQVSQGVVIHSFSESSISPKEEF
jgi:hypothetical protein